MTIADKTEISNLINSAKAMQSCVDNIKWVYHDDKIAEYAKSAIKNCIEVKQYIKDTIGENIALFFDISKPIKLTNDNGGTDWLKLRNGQSLTFDYKDGLNIKFYPIAQQSVINFVKDTYSASFMVTSTDAFVVQDVFPRVYHNTKHPDYDIGYSYDLIFNNHDRITNFDCEYDGETWKKIYNYAKNTRAKTEFLIRAFKAQLGVINSNIKSEATKREQFLEYAKMVEKYTKVGF
jgi:hypothetical protein